MKTFRDIFTFLFRTIHKRKYSIRTAAAVIVVFMTLYVMTIPAVTMNFHLTFTDELIEELPKQSPEEPEKGELKESLKVLPKESADEPLGTLTATASDGTTVIISGDFPKNAKASVTPLPYSNEEFNEYLSQFFSESAVNDMNSVTVYDISILVDGEEWEPEEAISVSVKIHEFEDEQNIIVSHLVEKDGDKFVENVDTKVAENGEISFKAESLSPWVFYTYTVDFYYNNALYHLVGGSEILLSELFGELGIAESSADVTDVMFSDPTLINIKQQGLDWLIVSLQPFTTEETLTVTFNNGNSLVILVKDDDSFTSITYNSGSTFAINTWYRANECAWLVDSGGVLYIRPNEVTTKSTPLLKNWCPWFTGSFDARTYIKKVKFLTTTKSGTTRYPYLAVQAGTMFSECTNLTEVDFTNARISSQTVNMSYMFQDCMSLNSIVFGNNVDTSGVTNMEYMFYKCSSLKNLDLSAFNTSNVTTMTAMFNGCSALTTLNVSSFDTSSVTNMKTMFKDCSSLIVLDVSSFNTSRVTVMNSMFNNCSSLTALDVSNFSTVAVKTTANLFYNCNRLEYLTFGRGFTCTNTKDMSYMFYNCYYLKELDLNCLNPASLENANYMFFGVSSIKELDLSGFATPSLTTTECMFGSMNSLTTLDLSGLDTRKARISGSNGSGGIVNLFGTGATNKSITTIILGANTNFYPAESYGSSFLRGTWRKDNTTDYTSGDIAELMVNNGSFAGTYVRINERSLVPHYIVAYKIDDLTYDTLDNHMPVISGTADNKITVKLYDANGNVTKSTIYDLNTEEACRWVKSNDAWYLYVNLNSIDTSDGTVTIPHIEIEGLNITWKWKNVVETDDGRKYDFQLTQSGFTLNNVIYNSSETSKWFNIAAQFNEDFHLESFVKYESRPGVYSDATNVKKASSIQKSEVKVVDGNGTPQLGHFTFASYDIDVMSQRDKDNGFQGYKYNSEGFYLVDGFNTSTIKYDMGDGGLIQDLGLVNTNNAGVSNVLNITASSTDKSYRITGKRDDSGSEQSEFCIQADAQSATFIWTGSYCGTVIMNGYQTEIFAVNKVDEKDPSISLSGARLSLYQTHYYENGALIEERRTQLTTEENFITDKDNPKSYFLWPGIYKVVETEAPECYILKDEPIYYLIRPDYYLYIEDQQGTYTTVYTHTLTDDEATAVTNTGGGYTYTDPVSGVVYTATYNAAEGVFTIEMIRKWTQVSTTSSITNLPTINVENEPGAVLPNTGGTGKMPFIAVVVLLPVVVFAVFVFKKAWITR